MAEAARNVLHYVSDCLQERHPYDTRKAFACCPERDRGLVYNGMQPHSVDSWIGSLSDPSVGDAQRVKALRLLIAHSALQETKITLLQKEIVPAVVAVLENSPSEDLECQVFTLLRSLCVLSQGCRCVIDGGGLEAAIRSIHEQSRLVERMDARTMAMMVLYQISFNAAGVRWLLGVEVPCGLELPDVTSGYSTFVITEKEVIASIVFVLEHHVECSPKMLLYAVTSLAQLTAITEGIFFVIQGNAVQVVAFLLRFYASDVSWLVEEEVIELVTQLLIVIWNVALEQTGVELLDELDVPEDIFRIFLVARKRPLWCIGSLLRALSGALSAVYKLLSVKMRSLDAFDGDCPRIEVIYEFLRGINSTIDVMKKSKQKLHNDLLVTSKNIVLCTHFAAEVKSVRDFTHKYISKMANNGTSEAFYFRRQLFYSTKWEEEFDAGL